VGKTSGQGQRATGPKKHPPTCVGKTHVNWPHPRGEDNAW